MKTWEACRKSSWEDLKVATPIKPFQPTARPCSLVGVDCEKMPKGRGGLCWLAVCVDYTTNWTEARALKNKTARLVARFIFEDVFCRHGFLRYVLSDRGGEFRNKVMKELSMKLGISQKFTNPYSPQTNGLCERTNGILADRLAKCLKGDRDNWPEILHSCLFAMRTSKNSATLYAPMELTTGRPIYRPNQAEVMPEPDIDAINLQGMQEGENLSGYRGNNAGATELSGDEFSRSSDGKAGDGHEAAEGGGMTMQEQEQFSQMPNSQHDRSFLSSNEAQRKRIREALANQGKRSKRNKKDHDKRTGAAAQNFEPGTKVLVANKQYDVLMHGKLGYKWSGPFAVLHQNKSSIFYNKDGKDAEASLRHVRQFHERPATLSSFRSG